MNFFPNYKQNQKLSSAHSLNYLTTKEVAFIVNEVKIAAPTLDNPELVKKNSFFFSEMRQKFYFKFSILF